MAEEGEEPGLRMSTVRKVLLLSEEEEEEVGRSV